MKSIESGGHTEYHVCAHRCCHFVDASNSGMVNASTKASFQSYQSWHKIHRLVENIMNVVWQMLHSMAQLVPKLSLWPLFRGNASGHHARLELDWLNGICQWFRAVQLMKHLCNLSFCKTLHSAWHVLVIATIKNRTFTRTMVKKRPIDEAKGFCWLWRFLVIFWGCGKLWAIVRMECIYHCKFCDEKCGTYGTIVKPLWENVVSKPLLISNCYAARSYTSGHINCVCT